MPSWVQCRKTGKFIPKEEWLAQQDHDHRPFIQGDIESFKSPIDGTIISDRAQLREHHRKHNTTDMRDYSQSFFEQKHRERSLKATGQTKEARQERIELIKRTIDHYEKRR